MTWSTARNLVADSAIKAGQVSSYSTSLSGVDEVALMLDVSVAPRQPTPVRVYAQYSLDGTNWSHAETVGQFIEASKVGRYGLHVKTNAPYARFAISPLNYGLSASVDASTR